MFERRKRYYERRIKHSYAYWSDLEGASHSYVATKQHGQRAEYGGVSPS